MLYEMFGMFFVYLEQYLSCIFIFVYLAICNVQYQVNDLFFNKMRLLYSK